MTRPVHLSRRAALAGLASLAAPGALANVSRSPRPMPRLSASAVQDPTEATRALIAKTGLSGQVACVVADAHSGKPILSIQPDLLLPPASVTKSITAAYAFDHLGPGHRFVTRVMATGPVRNGILDGDLILAGGGAPGLDTLDLARLAAAVKETGLREVRGRFLIWSGALPEFPEIAPVQPDHLGYNPSVSGLNLNYNRVYFEWRLSGADYRLSMDARAGDLKPAVSHARARLASRNLPIYDHDMVPQTGAERWSVARSALGSGGSRWLPVRDGGLYAGDVFRTLMRAEGIALSAAARIAPLPPEAATLASLPSPPLAEIASGMLKHSTNLTAEVLGLASSARQIGAPAADLAASGAAMTLWAQSRLGLQHSHFVDHSGLGDGSRSTAADLCRALHVLGPEGALTRVLKDISLRRKDGSPEPLRLRAKTGTLNFVSALSGHVSPQQGPKMIFAILTADMERRAGIAPENRENPVGSSSWTRRSRAMQFNMIRLWSGQRPV